VRGVRNKVYEWGHRYTHRRTGTRDGGPPRRLWDRRCFDHDRGGSGIDGDPVQGSGSRQEAGDQYAGGDGDPEQERGDAPLHPGSAGPLSHRKHPD